MVSIIGSSTSGMCVIDRRGCQQDTEGRGRGEIDSPSFHVLGTRSLPRFGPDPFLHGSPTRSSRPPSRPCRNREARTERGCPRGLRSQCCPTHPAGRLRSLRRISRGSYTGSCRACLAPKMSWKDKAGKNTPGVNPHLYMRRFPSWDGVRIRKAAHWHHGMPRTDQLDHLLSRYCM